MTPATAATDFIDLEHTWAAHNYHPLEVVLTRGEGVYVYDVEGKRYLDFLAAYSAVNQGHCHPRIVAALVAQAQRLALTSRAFHNDRFGPLCAKLCQRLDYPKALLMNTGAEAVETAIKAARKWAYRVKGVPTDRAEIIVFAGNFHGRTTTIVGFSDDPLSRDGYGPFPVGFRQVPYGDLAAAKAAFGPNTAAVLVEPIQGEAGIIVPPRDFLPGLQDACRQHRALLVCDEIQSGLGRAGAWLAHTLDGVRADAVVLGKALSGGMYPVSAFLTSDEVMDVFEAGSHGSTYGGNPLACAVADAALDVLTNERLPERAADLGTRALARLRGLRSPHIAEIRGRGLWFGIELRPSAGGARRFAERLRLEGLLCKETHTHTLRLAPPLVITPEQLDGALDTVARVLTSA